MNLISYIKVFMWKIKYITTTDYDGVYMKLKQVKIFLIESLWQTHGKQTILTICKLNKTMFNSKLYTPFNVCMKDKKYSRKTNYLPYLVDKCL